MPTARTLLPPTRDGIRRRKSNRARSSDERTVDESSFRSPAVMFRFFYPAKIKDRPVRYYRQCPLTRTVAGQMTVVNDRNTFSSIRRTFLRRDSSYRLILRDSLYRMPVYSERPYDFPSISYRILRRKIPNEFPGRRPPNSSPCTAF